MRKALSKRARFNVFKRDLFVCQYCGGHPPDKILEVDHVIPVAEGGTNDEDNLVTACFDCNRGKAAESLTIIPKSLTEQGEEIREREEQLAGYRLIVEDQRARIEQDAWRVADALIPNASEDGIHKERFLSIKRFLEKLPLHDALDAAEIAAARKPYSVSVRWKYFCGVCWNKIRDREGK